MHGKSGQQGVLQRLPHTILGDGCNQEHFFFSLGISVHRFSLMPSWRHSCFYRKTTGQLHPLSQSFLSNSEPTACGYLSLRNIPTQKVCDVYNRESRGYVHTQGNSSGDIFNPKARGKHSNSPQIVCPSTSSGFQRNPL